MKQPCPRLLLAALRGGAGKTTLTLGLLAAWRDQGRRLVPFKKGPDYIDPAWHALAAGCPSHNLDPFLMEGDQIMAMVARQAAQADALLIEGNRGLYDGLDAQGTYSTAELAKFLATPVVLVVDCTMRTRTTAAMVLGCQHFDPEVPIRGVILNQIARPRHEDIIRQAIERYCGIPVLGGDPPSQVRGLSGAPHGPGAPPGTRHRHPGHQHRPGPGPKVPGPGGPLAGGLPGPSPAGLAGDGPAGCRRPRPR